MISLLESQGGDGRDKLLRLFAFTRSLPNVVAIELAVRDWARRDKRVGRRVRRVDNRRIDYLRSLFRDFCNDDDEVEVRSTLVMTLFAGSPLVAADHGSLSRDDVLSLIGRRLLA